MTTVYVVDDHALLRDALRALLASHQHIVVGESGNVHTAWADICRLVPDILLLDLNLSSASGLELQERIVRQKIPTRTIVLTADAQVHQALEAHRLGVAGFVFKGTSGESLLQAIEVVKSGNRCWRPRAQALLERTSPSSLLAMLSPREIQIVQLVVRGSSSSAIGERLFLSPKTVDTYRSRLMAKLGVRDIPSLVRLAIREGLIGLDDG
jgi:two-component system, NarL family, invasion response regulator UvrY